jgi:hypothetical protein
MMTTKVYRDRSWFRLDGMDYESSSLTEGLLSRSDVQVLLVVRLVALFVLASKG